MKKTILVSALTTIVTMFVIMVCMHMCKSHCSQSKCSKSSYECGSSYRHGGDSHGECASYRSCSSNSKCSKSFSCKEGRSKCSKACKEGITSKTCKYKSEDGKTIVKKVIKVEIDEEK